MIEPRTAASCFLGFAIILTLTACGGGGTAGPATGFAYENKPENLKALMEQIHQDVHVKKDNAHAQLLFLAMVPDAARAAKAMKDDVAEADRTAILDMHKQLSESLMKSQEGISTICKAEQTVVKVHAATTEQIIKYEKDTPAFMEFPGGTRRVAERVLKPGMTFYEVEYLEPDKDAGMKYHLFYWDGSQWAMLGPAWRVLK